MPYDAATQEKAMIETQHNQLNDKSTDCLNSTTPEINPIHNSIRHERFLDIMCLKGMSHH